jgi:tRNA 2-thiouridine synthesizing protein B
MLHIVSKSPLERAAFASCLRVAAQDSAILLIEDGVYAATRGTDAAAQIGRHAGSMRFYALGPDLEARGVKDRIVEGVEVVDYEGFVDLVAAHATVQSWL